MSKYKPTLAQIEARQERRAAMRNLAKKVAAMSEPDRDQLSRRFPIATIEGRALSLHNQCLLIFQAGACPITIVGGFRQWKRAGRSVKKGERGLSIWIPLGKKDSANGDSTPDAENELRFGLGTVFDISQTEENNAAEPQHFAPQVTATAAPLACQLLNDMQQRTLL